MREPGRLYIFTYINILTGVITKTGIREFSKRSAKEYFLQTHSQGCRIITIDL